MPGLNSIDGLSSGLNTTEIIDTLIQFERRNAVLFEDQVKEKTNIISTLKALQAKFVALSTQISNLSRRATFESSLVKVSDETKLSARSTGKLGSGSYDIQVLALARNHQLASQGISDELIASLGTGTINIQVGNGSASTITVNANNNSLVGIKNAINDAALGVTASIINDGSPANPYRLLISANKTGISNKISITSSLTGGTNFDFVNSKFDVPENVSFDTGSDSKATLGATASYTGNQNKVYTFTVQGSGQQTVGSGTININWTDGTNSGSIAVTAAAAEVALTGTGSDGLKLNFSAGKLKAGDVFQVSTFSPLLQDAADSRITVGSTGGSGSPVTVTSSTNTFKDLVSGLELNVLAKTDAGKSVTVNTSVDTTGIRTAVNEFIKRYNEINEFIDKQNTFNTETKESGVLFGDLTVQTLQNSLRQALGSNVAGITGKFNHLFSIGIRTLGDGRLAIADFSRFDSALQNNLNDVINLFTNSASASSTFVEFVSASPKTKVGETLEVDITQAATSGRLQGSVISDPATSAITLNNTNNRLRFMVDGVESNDIILAEKTYNTIDALINEIKSKIAADTKIGNRGIAVEWKTAGAGTGFIEITNGTFGATSKIENMSSTANSAFAILGLISGSSLQGLDVQGTIGGEAAKGEGQFLTGQEGNLRTDGLRLKVTLKSSQLISGSESTVTFSRGLAARLNDQVDSITAFGEGVFDRRIKSFEGQITQLTGRVKDIDTRLALRRQSLLLQFQQMETSLSQLNGQSQFLSGQITSISQNWSTISRNRS